MLATLARCPGGRQFTRVDSDRPLSGGRGVVLRQLVQHSLFRNRELVGIRHHRQNFALLGDQKPLKLARTDRGIKPDGSLIRDSAVDFGGDRVEALDAFDRGRMRTGERFRERTIGVCGCAVLSRQRGLPFADGGDRLPGLICTPVPSGLIRTVAPA
jgi:hypothetical protein